MARTCTSPSQIPISGLAIHDGHTYALTSSDSFTRTSSHISAILISGDRRFVQSRCRLIIQCGCDWPSLWINTQNAAAWLCSLCSSGGRPASTSATDSATVRLYSLVHPRREPARHPVDVCGQEACLLLLDRFYDLVLRRVLKEQSFWNILSLRRCKSWSESLDDLTYAYAPRWSTCWRTNL